MALCAGERANTYRLDRHPYSAFGSELAARRPANPITLRDGHGADFVIVTGQILMAADRWSGSTVVWAFASRARSRYGARLRLAHCHFAACTVARRHGTATRPVRLGLTGQEPRNLLAEG